METDRAEKQTNSSTDSTHSPIQTKEIRKPCPNRMKPHIGASSMERHPSGRHLSEHAKSVVEPNNLHSFRGVNVSLASPTNKNGKLPSIVIDHIDNKVYEASETYYTKSHATATPKANNRLVAKHLSLASLSFQQQRCDDLLTQSIRNKEGFGKMEAIFSSFHSLKKD